MTQTITLLDRLISFDTVSTGTNLHLIAFVEEFLKSRGFTVTRLNAPQEEKAGLYATIGPDGDGVMLSAHTDVVPVDGQDWTRPPFRLTEDGDRLFGRGTTDMKGYLAAMLTAADKAAALPLKAPLKLCISYDEEIGCLGIAQMMDRLQGLMGRPRVCIVGEPTSMQVAVGHKGKRALKAVCTGQAGHSALAPRFVNALHLATDFIAELRELQNWLRDHGARDHAYDILYSTVHVGTLSGGTALNIVPDRSEMLFEFRHLAEEAPDMIAARIHAAADRVAKNHPNGAINISTVNAYPGLDVAPDAGIVTLVQALAARNETTKVGFGTEAGFFDALGIPTLVCGPGSMEGQGHKPDEYIEKSQLAACDTMMERVLDRLI
jgi:acetylornithine deacetylase